MLKCVVPYTCVNDLYDLGDVVKINETTYVVTIRHYPNIDWVFPDGTQIEYTVINQISVPVELFDELIAMPAVVNKRDDINHWIDLRSQLNKLLYPTPQ